MVARTFLGCFAGASMLLAALPAAAAKGICAPYLSIDTTTSSLARSHNAPNGISVIEKIGDTTLVGAYQGLFRIEGDQLVRFDAKTDTGEVNSIQRIGNSTWVSASDGLFRLEGKRLVPVDPDTETRGVIYVYQIGNVIIVRAVIGLFRLDGDKLIRVEPNAYTLGIFHAVERVGDTILVGTKSGLLRLEGNQLVPIKPDTDTGYVRSIKQIGDMILVDTVMGLFRFKDNTLVRLGWTGEVHVVGKVGDMILVGTENGLFWSNGNQVTQIESKIPIGSVRIIKQVGDLLLVGAAKGLFLLDKDELVRLENPGTVSVITQIGDEILVGARGGLYRLENKKLIRTATYLEDPGIEESLDEITLVEKIGNLTFIGAHDVLFILINGDRFVRVESDSLIGTNVSFLRFDSNLWISSEKGLFRYVEDTYHAEGPRSAPTFGPDTTAAIRFTTSPCLGLLDPNEFALVQDSPAPHDAATSSPVIPADITVTGAPMRRIVTATIGALEAGTLRVRLAVASGESWEPVSDPVEVRVAWTPVDYAAHHLRQAAPWLAGGHTVLFLLLLAAARRSAWCWRVVSDPFWGRTGLWWHFALRHVPALQRWVLARWFDAARRRDWRPYLSVPLAGPDSEILAAETLFDRLRTHPRLWVQGGSGMGKTTLVSDLARQFFAGHTSLRAAYRRYGFIPIIVRLRNVLDVKPDPAHPDRLLSELARKALRADGLRIDDPALFRAILESGSFALILDGANETPNARALVDYASNTPEIRFLVTSQADPTEPSNPEKPGFELLRLPSTVEEMVSPLLSQFLGPERGTAVLEAVRPTPLWLELTSGYDVRLLADLAGHDGPVPELPADRISLYRALLGRLRHAGGPYPEAELSRAAWAMWRDGVRQFDGTKYLTPDLIEPLRHENARVVRTIEGTLQEFRHDQMRGYLAAVGAARYEVAPIRLFETDKAIWRLYFHEQAPVWEFFAALVDQARGEAIWQWCHDDPERAVLLHALDQQGRREGWRLVRNAPEQVGSTVT